MKTKYVKQNGRWYPIINYGTCIDMRGPGYKTLREARERERERKAALSLK